MLTANQARAEERKNRLEDAEFLICVGTDWPDRIAHRLGYRDAENLAVILNRAGRQDLTEKLRRLDRTSFTYRTSFIDDEERRIRRRRAGQR